MTNNEIWNNSELTKRQKVVLCYQTPVELRQAQLEYWKLEAEGKEKEANAMYKAAYDAWYAAKHA